MDRVKARIVVVQRVSSRLTGKSIDEAASDARLLAIPTAHGYPF